MDVGDILVLVEEDNLKIDKESLVTASTLAAEGHTPENSYYQYLRNSHNQGYILPPTRHTSYHLLYSRSRKSPAFSSALTRW